MSRYLIGSQKYPNLDIFVGWDAPMRSFFYIIEDPEQSQEEINLKTNHEEISTVEELVAQIAQYVVVSKEILSKLRQDSLQPFIPGKMQQFTEHMFKDWLLGE